MRNQSNHIYGSCLRVIKFSALTKKYTYQSRDLQSSSLLSDLNSSVFEAAKRSLPLLINDYNAVTR